MNTPGRWRTCRAARSVSHSPGTPWSLVYRPLVISEPPGTFSETLSSPCPLIFTAADPQALFTLAQYQASGGEILDDQGRPSLQSQPLKQVLEYYQQGVTREQIPSWTTEFQDDEQTWQAFNDNKAPMVITWLSRYLNSMLSDTAGAPIPTPEGKPYSAATGWVWAMASPDPEHERLSAELAEFLSEGDFLARWTSALEIRRHVPAPYRDGTVLPCVPWRTKFSPRPSFCHRRMCSPASAHLSSKPPSRS